MPFAKDFFFNDGGYMLSPFDINEEKIKTELENILEDSKRYENKIPVISHERLSGNPHSGGFDAKKIAHMLKQTFSSAKILIMIREQKNFIFSNYFQYLSIGGTKSLEQYLSSRYDGRIPFFSPDHIRYIPLILEYYNLFGKDKVLVLPYEMFSNDPVIFLKRLNQFLNLDIQFEQSMFEQIYNKKSFHFSNYSLRVLNLFRQSSSVNNYSSWSNKYFQKAADGLVKVLGALTSSRLEAHFKHALQTEIATWVADRYLQSNKKLSQLIEIDLSQYGYY